MKETELKKAGEEVAKITKKKRSRPDLSESQVPKPNPGDNARYIRHSLRLSALPKVSMQDAEAVEKRVFEYFEICEEEDMKPSVAGLALALNVDRTYLWDLRTERKTKNPEIADTLKKAVKILDAQMVDYMQNGQINPVSGIFLMKNNFGYADKQEVVVTPQSPLGDASDTKTLEEKYAESVVLDENGEKLT